MENKNPLVKVTPVRWADHKNFSDRVAIRGHPNFYVNLLNGKITYKRGPVRISTGKNTIKAAKDFVDAELKMRATGQSIESIKRTRLGISNLHWREIWEELMQIKKQDRYEATQKTYRSNWRYGIAPFWEDKTTLDLTPETITEYKLWYLKKYSDKGRLFDKTYVHFHMLLTFARERKYISDFPPNLANLEDTSDTIKKRSQYKKAGRTATQSEVDSLISATDEIVNTNYGGEGFAHKKMLSARARLAIVLAATMGLRKTEAVSLLKERVNLKKSEIEVWSKNKYWRIVPMSKLAAEAFKEQSKYNAGSKYIFPLPCDPTRHIYSQILDKVWGLTKRLAGIETRLRFHDLRHTFATKTAEDNWPPIIACKVLDMSLKIYQRVYCKPSDEKIAEYMRKSF